MAISSRKRRQGTSQSKMGMVIVFLAAGLAAGGLYYQIQKPLPEVSGVFLKPQKSISEEKKIETEPEKATLPPVFLSAEKLEQADALLIRVKSATSTKKISTEFNFRKIDFFRIDDSQNWYGILGISVKEMPGKYDLIISIDGFGDIEKEITVLKRDFPIKKLIVTEDLEEKGYTPQKILENIATKETPTIKEITAIYSPEAYFKESFGYPLEEIKDVGHYGDIRQNGDIVLQHLGVDLDAETGTDVYAINNGIVRFIGELPDYGRTLILDHGLGIFSLYLHLDEFKAKKGDLVEKGKVIGLSGNTGYSIAPHLHFSVRVNNKSVDPLRFVETTKGIK